MSPTRRGYRRLLVVTLVLFLMVGGAAWAAARLGVSGPGVDRQAVDLAELRARPPIYRLLYTWTAPKERVAVAKQRLITRCMAAHGFTYRPAPVAKAGDARSPRPTPFGLETLADPTGSDPDETLPPEKPQSEAFNRALFGDPGSRISAKGKQVNISAPAAGCQAEAERRLIGDGQTRWLQLRIRLGEGEDESRKRLEQDPAFQTATTHWRECMHSSGIQAKDPVQLLKTLRPDTDIDTHPATRADISCKHDTDYLTIAYTRLAAMQSQWLNENPGLLEARESLLARQHTAARDILSER